MLVIRSPFLSRGLKHGYSRIGHFRVAPGLCIKKLGLVLSLRYGNVFHSHANKTHFHYKGCALGLILKVRVLELGSGLFKISVTLLKEG